MHTDAASSTNSSITQQQLQQFVELVPAIMQQCYSVKWGGLNYPGLETYYVHGKHQVWLQLA
jgi:hypothetical protein